MADELRVLHDGAAAAGAAAARALVRFAPPELTVSLGELDASGDVAAALGDQPPARILLLSHAAAPAVRAALEGRGWPVPLVTAFTGGWPDELPAFFAAYTASDALLVSTRSYWEGTGRLRGTRLAPWGVDRDVFRVSRPIDGRPPVVLWTGPADDPERTGYARLVEPLVHELRQRRGLGCELLPLAPRVPAPSPAARAAWYNTGTVFVCASRTEGTSQAALEAAACGCTVVGARVGVLPELVMDGDNGLLVDRDPAALLRAVEAAARDYPRLAHRMQADIERWSWAERSRPFLEPPPAPAPAGPDLSAEVTVFVTTIGAPSYPACRELLRRQDCTFRLEVLEGIKPLRVALQRMLDTCQTPYYVQVDEDMLLRPDAVRTLHGGISAAGPEVAMVVGQLYDVHLGRCIRGVKIARNDISRHYPWGDQPSVLHRLTGLIADGFRIEELPVADHRAPADALGLHGTHASPEALYARYRGLARLRRDFPVQLGWLDPYPAVWLEEALTHRSPADVHALLGWLAGALGSPRAGDDAPHPSPPPRTELEALARYLETLGLGGHPWP
jgi:hypothetical protein